MRKERITRERLLELFDYNRETGELRWKQNRGTAKAGGLAGGIDTWGYRQIRVDGRVYQAHILVWFLEKGVWPVLEIDHRDTVKLNNRFKNLRLATRRQNASNCEVRSHSKSGIKGVHELPNGKFDAIITVKGRSRSLGTFSEKMDAALIYAHTACKLFGEFASPSTKALSRSDSILLNIEAYGSFA